MARRIPAGQGLVKLEPALVAQLDQVSAGILQAVEGITAVGVILLDQEVLSAAFQTSLDASLQGQGTCAQLSKADGLCEECVCESLHVEALGHVGHLNVGDLVVLQVQQTDGAGILLDELNGVLAAAVDPVGIQLEAHGGSILAEDVQQVLAVLQLHELDVVVVVVQVDAVFLQLQAVLFSLLCEVDALLNVADGVHGHHADTEHINVQGAGVVDVLLVVVLVGQVFAGHAGEHGIDGSGQGGEVEVQLVDGLTEAGDVFLGHGDLGNFCAVEADVGQAAHNLEGLKAGHLGGGDGGHLNADQTFFAHGNTLLISY